VIVLFKSLSVSFDAYMKKPVQFVLSTFSFLFFNLLVLFALFGIFLVFFILMSVFQLTDNVVPFAILLAILLVFYLYIMCGLCSALIKAYSTLTDGSKFSFMDFYRHSISKGWNIFTLCILNLILIAIIAAPVVFAFVSYFPDHPMPYVDIILLLMFLFAFFVLQFLFYPAYIAASVYDAGFVRSFALSFQLLMKKHVFSLLLFAIYSLGIFTIIFPFVLAYALLNFYNFIWGFALAPFLAIIPLFVIFPITYNSLIVFFKSYVGR